MYMTIKTIITFVPEEEKEAHTSFLKSNNIEQWKIEQATVGISYVKTERFFIDTKVKGE